MCVLSSLIWVLASTLRKVEETHNIDAVIQPRVAALIMSGRVSFKVCVVIVSLGMVSLFVVLLPDDMRHRLRSEKPLPVTIRIATSARSVASPAAGATRELNSDFDAQRDALLIERFGLDRNMELEDDELNFQSLEDAVRENGEDGLAEATGEDSDPGEESSFEEEPYEDSSSGGEHSDFEREGSPDLMESFDMESILMP
ncbi:hypothetical protein FVE85_8101 [Porphyridium purpureum]|uniref:Uncharacterized protein n=1 Tax=Porphyridium purpureum TaxID=35688 RepID=A0A5J4YPH8_PORPP|nr:hypothetical protein FVE85_8101 [Porphyridium purpureum]|eukprot:POR8741..scf295_9